MSSTGGGTGLTQRNYRLASDMDKPRSTGTPRSGAHSSLPDKPFRLLHDVTSSSGATKHPSGSFRSSNAGFACVSSGVVSDRLLSDYLHHVFPSNKPSPR